LRGVTDKKKSGSLRRVCELSPKKRKEKFYMYFQVLLDVAVKITIDVSYTN
jgi:hypothetical protein